MKRRTVFQSLAGVAALAPAAAAQTPPSSNAPTADDAFKLDLTVPDAVADARHRYFTPQQYATLEKLAGLIAPAYNGRPSAAQAEVPQFLDFLLSKSQTERQMLYTQGLDQLDIDARAKKNKAFAELTDADAAELLAPLKAKWTWKAPAAQLPRFLREAKNDILRATANSKAAADAAAGSRRGTGVNTYWDVID